MSYTKRKKTCRPVMWWRRKRKRAKKKTVGTAGHIKTMDVILAIIALALLAFTIEMIRLFRETGTVPDTLIACVFAALTGECGAMAWIKTSKERSRERKWELEDRQHAEQREDKIRKDNEYED